MKGREFSDCGSEEFCKFAKDQLSCWPLARDNFRALKSCRYKTIKVNGLDVKVQLNPSRVASTKVDTSAEAIASRPCFLCLEHRPKQQKNLNFEGAKSKRYRVQLNPYPIFPDHFVIAADKHAPQLIWHRIVDMLRLAKRHRDFTFMYNGPKCGASVPDHFHFQAIPKGELPLETDVLRSTDLEYICSLREAELFRYPRFANGIFVIKGKTSKSVAKLFYRLLDCCPVCQGDGEPRFNLFSLHENGVGYTTIVVLRTQHRSSHYFSLDSQSHLAMSPGCADMGGVMITVDEEDFDKLSPELMGEMLREITLDDETQSLVLRRLTRSQAKISVMLQQCESLEFEVVSDGAGRRSAVLRDGRIEYGGMLYDELFFEAKTSSTMFAGTSFVLYREDVATCYPGALRLAVREGRICVVNIIGAEDFLRCTTSCPSVPYASYEEALEAVVSARADVLSAARSEAGEDGDGNVCLKAETYGYRGLPSGSDALAEAAVDASWL